MKYYKKDEPVIESRRRFLGRLVGLMGLMGVGPSIQLDFLNRIALKLGYKEALAVGASDGAPKVVIELVTRAGDAANKFLTCQAALSDFRVSGDNSGNGLRAHLWAGPLADPLGSGNPALKNLEYASLGNGIYVPDYEGIASKLSGVPMAHFLCSASGHSSNLALRRGKSGLTDNQLDPAHDLPNFASLHAATLEKQSITGGKVIRWRGNTVIGGGQPLRNVLHPLGDSFQNYASSAGLIVEPQMIDLGDSEREQNFRAQFDGDLVIGDLSQDEKVRLAETIDELTAKRLTDLQVTNSAQILGYTGGLVQLLGIDAAEQLVLSPEEEEDFDSSTVISPFTGNPGYNLGSAFGHIFKSLELGLAQSFVVERDVGDQHPEEQPENQMNYGWQGRYAEEAVNFANVLGGFWERCKNTPSPFSPDKMLSEDVMIVVSSEFGRAKRYDDGNTDGGDTSVIVISDQVNPGSYYNYNNSWSDTFYVNADDPNGELHSVVNTGQLSAERAWKTIASMISSQTANALSDEDVALFLKKS